MAIMQISFSKFFKEHFIETHHLSSGTEINYLPAEAQRAKAGVGDVTISTPGREEEGSRECNLRRLPLKKLLVPPDNGNSFSLLGFFFFYQASL